jgi:hypothetical protein
MKGLQVNREQENFLKNKEGWWLLPNILNMRVPEFFL